MLLTDRRSNTDFYITASGGDNENNTYGPGVAFD